MTVTKSGELLNRDEETKPGVEPTPGPIESMQGRIGRLSHHVRHKPGDEEWGHLLAEALIKERDRRKHFDGGPPGGSTSVAANAAVKTFTKVNDTPGAWATS